MINIKGLIIFVVSSLAFWVLFQILVPNIGLDQKYHKNFISWGNSLFGEWGEKGKVEFIYGPPAPKTIFKNPFGEQFDKNILIKILNQDHVNLAIEEARKRKLTQVNVTHAEFLINPWVFSLTSMIFLFALIFGYLFYLVLGSILWKHPFPVFRLFLAPIIGFALMNLFVLFRFWVRFVTEINRHGWLEVGSLSTGMLGFFRFLNTIFMHLGISLLFVVIIWAISCVRFSDKDLFILPPK